MIKTGCHPVRSLNPSLVQEGCHTSFEGFEFGNQLIQLSDSPLVQTAGLHVVDKARDLSLVFDDVFLVVVVREKGVLDVGISTTEW
jgi:hypothetical protein